MEEFLDDNPIKIGDLTDDMAKTKGDGYLTSKYATFIFISDFGTENFSHQHSHEELLEIIENDIINCWGDNLVRVNIFFVFLLLFFF